MAGRINMMGTENTFDTLIIGAGLAGLSAAYHLQDFQTLLLEQQPCAGGRISTQSFDGHVYDVGAVLGYDPAYLPFDFSPPKALEEQGPIGLFFEGHVHLGESVTDCLRAVFPEHSRESSTLLALQSGTAGLSSLTHNACEILNAFFQVIHPGEIEDYLPAFQGACVLALPTTALYQRKWRTDSGLSRSYTRTG